MKTTTVLLILTLHLKMVHAGDTLKPIPPSVPKNPCGAFAKENNSKRLIPYTSLREGDVMWEKRVWREIDMRERQNQQLYFPLEPNACRTSLIHALMNNILSEKIVPLKMSSL